MKIIKMNPGDILKLKKTEPVMYWFVDMRLDWIDECSAGVLPFKDGVTSFFSQNEFKHLPWENSDSKYGKIAFDFADEKFLEVRRYHENY